MKNQLKFGDLKAHMGSTFGDIPDDAVVLRKQISSDVSIVDGEEQTWTAMITTPSIDRDNEVILPSGIDTSDYLKSPVVLFAHNHNSLPVAKCVALQASKDGLMAKMVAAPTDMGQDVWKLVRGGFLKSNSIGFIGLSAVDYGTKEFAACASANGISPECSRIWTSIKLLENSLVPIPSNQDALAIACTTKSLTIAEPLAKQLHIDDVKMEDMPEEEMAKPYPSEHAFRQHPPSDYSKFFRKNDAGGAGVDFIFGVRKDDGKSEVQSIRVDATKFTYEEAKAKVTSLGFSTAEGEPSSGKPKDDPAAPAEQDDPPCKDDPKAADVPEVKVEPVIEPTKVEPLWRVIRTGDLVLDDESKSIADRISKGEVV